MGRIPEIVSMDQNLETHMTFPRISNKTCLAFLGIALMVLGSVALLRGQGQQVRQVLRLGPDGAYLGIELEDVTADTMAKYKLSSETGVIVRSVEKGSPAETAHLQENDVILEYAGIPVFSAAEFIRLVQETPVNRTTSLVISRDGKKSNLSIKVGERKGAMSESFNLIGPDNLLRRFDLNQPGGNLFSFSTPGSGNRSLRLVMPSVGRRQLGVTVEALTDQMAQFLAVPGKKGVLVISVTEGTPAASVLRAGDVILSVDGKAVADPVDLSSALAGKTQGAKVELKIIRDKKEMSVTVETAKPLAARSGIKIKV